MSKQYEVIVVDPPWPIKKLTRRARPKQTSMDYSVMSLEDIARLPVGKLATEDSWCFLWTIQKYLHSPAKDILTGWGFKYLLTMVWEKTYGKSSGMPLYGFRWNGEFVLVGYKGKKSTWPKRPLIPAVFSAENLGHSTKPPRFYELVAPLGTSRIDLFARSQRDGWDVWGNEVESDIMLPIGEEKDETQS